MYLRKYNSVGLDSFHSETFVSLNEEKFTDQIHPPLLYESNYKICASSLKCLSFRFRLKLLLHDKKCFNRLVSRNEHWKRIK